MRTTVRIDDDLLRQIKDRAHREQTSMTKLLNEALRRGLNQPAKPRKPFVQKTYDLGEPKMDLTKALSLAFEMEDEETIRKMQALERKSPE
jgi:hypothetical protein